MNNWKRSKPFKIELHVRKRNGLEKLLKKYQDLGFLNYEFFQILIIKLNLNVKNFFHVMSSLFKASNYGQKFLIIDRVMNFGFKKLL